MPGGRGGLHYFRTALLKPELRPFGRVLALFGTDWRGICFEACILHLGIKEQILKEEGRKKERKKTNQSK